MILVNKVLLLEIIFFENLVDFSLFVGYSGGSREEDDGPDKRADLAV